MYGQINKNLDGVDNWLGRKQIIGKIDILVYRVMGIQIAGEIMNAWT